MITIFEWNQIDSIFPFSTFITCFASSYLPAFLWLKVHLWSSGKRCRLQKKYPHLHSMPISLSFRLQLKHRSLLISFFSSSGLSYSSTFARIYYFSSLDVFLGVINSSFLNSHNFTSYSIVSTSFRRPLSHRSFCSWHRGDRSIIGLQVSFLQCSLFYYNDARPYTLFLVTYNKDEKTIRNYQSKKQLG